MRDILDIVDTIETLSTGIFGSVNKMLTANGLSKSVVDNMKRSNPSTPNIQTFCKIAEALNVTTDYLLTGKEPPRADAAPLQAMDDDQKELLEILDRFEGRERTKFVGRCEGLATEILHANELLGESNDVGRLA